MTPDPTNLILGAGEVSFDRFDAAGASSGYLRSLGNVDAFGISSTVNTVEKRSSLTGTRALLADVTIGADVGLTLTLTEYDEYNLALALLGSNSFVNQAAQPTITAKAITASLVLDVWYDLGLTNVTVTDVKVLTLALNAAAYVVDSKAGMIKFLSSYTGANPAVAGTAVAWDGLCTALADADAVPLIHSLTAGLVRGHLCYVAAADQAAGPRYRVDVWKCTLFPDGDLPFIMETFGSFNFKGKVLQDASRAAGDQYVTVRRLK